MARSKAERVADSRARRRAEGLTAIEAVLHQNDIATLDRMKTRLGVSRSDVLRIVLAKIDQDAFTPADVALLQQSAA